MHRLPPGAILAILLGQALVLVLLLVLWVSWAPLRSSLPDGLLLAFMPAVVPWAGALGGATNALRSLAHYWPARSLPWEVTVGLKQLAASGAPLDSRVQKVVGQRLRWNAWDILQPLLGAVYGSFAVLLVALIIGAVGTSQDGLDTTARGKAVLAVVGFLVGYQQKVFHDLLDRSLSVLLGPGDVAEEGSASASGLLELAPAAVTMTADPGSDASQPVTITNGTGALVVKEDVHLTVRPAAGDADAFSVTQLRRNIGRRSTGHVVVTFRPPGAGDFHATLALDHEGATDQVELTGRSPVESFRPAAPPPPPAPAPTGPSSQTGPTDTAADQQEAGAGATARSDDRSGDLAAAEAFDASENSPAP